jgi:hypothetical protein
MDVPPKPYAEKDLKDNWEKYREHFLKEVRKDD